MKKLTVSLILLCAPLFAHAFGPEVCEPDAAAWVQENIDAYVSLAKQYPQQEIWQKYLSCEGRPITLVTSKEIPFSAETRLFSYKYSVMCGQTERFYGVDFQLKSRCIISGE